MVCLNSAGAPTRRSADASKELVASSSAKIAGFFRSARAIARRWRWPPLRLSLPTVNDCKIRGIPKMYVLTLRIETVRQSPNKFAVGLTRSSFDLLPRSVLVTVCDV
jgi:hypothetical protein